MNCDKKRRERVILAGALASFIFVCGALLHEGIQIVAEEQNGLLEATAGAIEANLPVGELKDGSDHAKTGIHNTVSAKETDAIGDDKRPNDARTDAVSGDERQSVKKDVMSGSEAVCLPSGSIVRGFGWQEESGVWRYHTGIDVAAASGSDVRAAVSGTVHDVMRGAGGYAVEVAAQDKLWRYEPLGEVTVSVGANIRIGERLGRTAIGADRLHIACRRKGEWIDPLMSETGR